MNDKELSDLLAGYLESAEAEHDLVAYLDSDAEQKAEVVALAKLAGELRSMPATAPSAVFRRQARRRLIAQLLPRLSWHKRLLQRLQAAAAAVSDARLPRRQAVIWLLLLMLVIVVSGGTLYSAEAALPGEALYPVKTSNESLRLAWARDEIHAGELHLMYATRRVNEIARLAQQGRAEPIRETSRNYAQHVATVQGTLQKLESGVPLVITFHKVVSAQELALAQVSGAAPPSARLDIDHALAVATDSRMVVQEFMLVLAPDIVTSTDLRLQFAGERLGAASSFMAWGNLALAESALNEYSSQVDEAVALVLSSGVAAEDELVNLLAERLALHETTLRAVEANAPAAASAGLQRARAASANGRNVVNAIMEGRLNPMGIPVEPPGQAAPALGSPTPGEGSPPAGLPTGVPAASRTPGARATGVVTTPPGGGPPAWVTTGPPGEGNQGQGQSKGNEGKGQGKNGLDNPGQGQGSQGQGNQGQGNQGQGNQGQGNQGQGNQEQGNQGQGNQGQGKSGKPGDSAAP
jgi:hypothetical protein